MKNILETGECTVRVKHCREYSLQCTGIQYTVVSMLNPRQVKIKEIEEGTVQGAQLGIFQSFSLIPCDIKS